MRALIALSAALLLLVGVAAPHHHAGASVHDCVACTVGSGLEARDATPAVARAERPLAAPPAEPGQAPVTGAPLGSVPGQSPPA